jgi:hypothetical protein
MPRRPFKSKSITRYLFLSITYFHRRCVSEFISFVTSEASDRCLQEKRKTINGEDILLAMLTLGFDSYVEPLRTFLTKVRDASKYDRTITMGGDLTDELRSPVAQAQMPPATTTTTASSSLPASTDANGLEPYGHSVGEEKMFYSSD